MREYILRISKMIWQGKVKSQGQSIDFDHMLAFCKIREEKGEKILPKLKYIQKLERKCKILIYNSWFFEKNWLYYDLLKITNQKIPK